MGPSAEDLRAEHGLPHSSPGDVQRQDADQRHRGRRRGLYQVGDRPFPPIMGARSTNLPVMASAMLGREAEREDLLQLIGDGDVRLVTVTGTGGIGKTRLALQVAGEIAEQFPGGVSFVSLSAIGEIGSMTSAIGQAVGVRVRHRANRSANCRAQQGNGLRLRGRGRASRCGRFYGAQPGSGPRGQRSVPCSRAVQVVTIRVCHAENGQTARLPIVGPAVTKWKWS